MASRRQVGDAPGPLRPARHISTGPADRIVRTLPSSRYRRLRSSRPCAQRIWHTPTTPVTRHSDPKAHVLPPIRDARVNALRGAAIAGAAIPALPVGVAGRFRRATTDGLSSPLELATNCERDEQGGTRMGRRTRARPFRSRYSRRRTTAMAPGRFPGLLPAVGTGAHGRPPSRVRRDPRRRPPARCTAPGRRPRHAALVAAGQCGRAVPASRARKPPRAWPQRHR